MAKSSKARRIYRNTTTPKHGKVDFASIGKLPVKEKALFRSLFGMFSSAERFERQHPQLIESMQRSLLD